MEAGAIFSFSSSIFHGVSRTSRVFDGCNKQVKGSEIFNKSETSKDKGKETGKKQGVDESVHKKRTVTENKIENSNDSSN